MMIRRNQFNLIPLNYKLTLLALVPLIVLIFFFYLIEKEKTENITGNNNFITRINLALAADDLVEQIQQERRLSLSNLFKGNENGALSVQQLKTDEAIQKFDTYVDSGLNAEYANYTFIDELPTWRSKINNKEMSYDEIFNSYQKLTERLSSFTAVSTDYSNLNREIGSRIALREILSNTINYLA
ncbi:MAG TPA: nitrate- and nitrite sensing domain-containing protein, partial [Pseudosphingobacterium sp.]|nr:nitrate- and nitrite sensing domain-containing protein [Pseudosphingobacterium sp.]